MLSLLRQFKVYYVKNKKKIAFIIFKKRCYLELETTLLKKLLNIDSLCGIFFQSEFNNYNVIKSWFKQNPNRWPLLLGIVSVVTKLISNNNSKKIKLLKNVAGLNNP